VLRFRRPALRRSASGQFAVLDCPSAGLCAIQTGYAGIAVHAGAAGGVGNDPAYTATLDSEGRILVVGSGDNGPDFDMVIWKFK
jgi:hypothetical protein